MSVEKTTSDLWVKCISKSGTIRAVAVNATETVRLLAKRHDLKGELARALGEVALGGFFVASYCKPGQKVNINIQTAGKIKQALIDAKPEGTIRGYVIGRDDDEVVKLENEGPWGDGVLSILRSHEKKGGQPYIGTVPLLTGHLAKDLTFYWAQSEQVPSATVLVVRMEGDEVAVAGGIVIQAMPGASNEEIAEVEEQLRSLKEPEKHFTKDVNLVQFLSQVLPTEELMLIEEKKLGFACQCTKEKVEQAIGLLGKDEIQEMIDKNETTEVRCDYCGENYQISVDDLRERLKSIK